jgi:hypothetical protein
LATRKENWQGTLLEEKRIGKLFVLSKKEKKTGKLNVLRKKDKKIDKLSL